MNFDEIWWTWAAFQPCRSGSSRSTASLSSPLTCWTFLRSALQVAFLCFLQRQEPLEENVEICVGDSEKSFLSDVFFR